MVKPVLRSDNCWEGGGGGGGGGGTDVACVHIGIILETFQVRET